MHVYRRQLSGWLFGTAVLLSGSFVACEAMPLLTDAGRSNMTARLGDGATEDAPKLGTPPGPEPAKPSPVARPNAPKLPGAIFDERSGLYVRRCGESSPCAALLLAPSVAACEQATFGDVKGWRLPSKEEFLRIKNLKGLEGPLGYHWTSTAYAEDAAQFWIVARDKSPSTTIPGTRKAFPARCVRTFE